MDTPVSKKPKKSMYYKMMRKAGMKKKMETDPAQWAQETPGPAKTGARSMENGDVVRRAGHGGGVVSDGPVAAVQPARRRDGENRKAAIAKTTNALTGIVLAAYVAVQVALPLRHFAYEGRVDWTEEGHRFAWRMMLREKRGTAHFVVRDPDGGRHWSVRLDGHLTSEQIRIMVGQPAMIWQFADYLEGVWVKEHGVADPEVTVEPGECRLVEYLGD